MRGLVDWQSHVLRYCPVGQQLTAAWVPAPCARYPNVHSVPSHSMRTRVKASRSGMLVAQKRMLTEYLVTVAQEAVRMPRPLLAENCRQKMLSELQRQQAWKCNW